MRLRGVQLHLAVVAAILPLKSADSSYFPAAPQGEGLHKTGATPMPFRSSSRQLCLIKRVQWRALLDSNQWPSASETDALSN